MEKLAALVAAEGFLARVRPAMRGENVAVGEALAALVAAEGFLASVRPAMLGETAAERKALTALVATEGFHSIFLHFGRSQRTWFIVAIEHAGTAFSGQMRHEKRNAHARETG